MTTGIRVTDPSVLGQEQRASVQLTNAQALALRATPITLVAAPGANRAIKVESVTIVSDAAAGVYTETADNIAIEYADGTDILTIETTGLIDQAAIETRHQNAPAATLTTPVANSAVRALNNGDGEWGGGNAANSISIMVVYRIIPTAKFGA